MKTLAAKTLAAFASVPLFLTGCQFESVPTSSQLTVETTEVGLTAVETTPAVFNLVGAPVVEFHVPDMMCEIACTPAVKDVLLAQPGVKEVQIDFPSRTVTVAVDEAKFDGEAAVAALVDYQFGSTKLITQE